MHLNISIDSKMFFPGVLCSDIIPDINLLLMQRAISIYIYDLKEMVSTVKHVGRCWLDEDQEAEDIKANKEIVMVINLSVSKITFNFFSVTFY